MKQSDPNQTPAASRQAEPTVRLQEGLRSAVVIVSGKDQKGVSAEFFRVLANYGVQLLDVQQSEFLGVYRHQRRAFR